MRVKSTDQQAIMMKYGMEVEQAAKMQNPIFEHDFSGVEESSDLVSFQRQLIAEAFAEELSLKNYHIKPEDIKATRQSVLDVADGVFTRYADPDMGPWEAARAYCRMRLEEAQARDLENNKKRVLENIKAKYLEGIGSHEDLQSFETLALMQLDVLKGNAETKQPESTEVMINDNIRRTLAEAASLLLDTSEEVAATAAEATPVATKTVTVEKTAAPKKATTRKGANKAGKSVLKKAAKVEAAAVPETSLCNDVSFDVCHQLIQGIKDEKGDLDIPKFMALSGEHKFMLFRFAGMDEDDLINPELLDQNVKNFKQFISDEEKDF